MLDIEPGVLAELGEHVVRLRFLLDDISHETDEHLRDRAMTALGRLVLWCLRSARTPDQLLADIARWADITREVRRAPTGTAALLVVWRYILLVSERYDPRDVVAHLVKVIGEEAKEEIMTAGQVLIEEGRKKGIEQGIENTLKATLLKQLGLRFGSLPNAVVAQVSAAGVERLNTWLERVIAAPTLADVLVDTSSQAP